MRPHLLIFVSDSFRAWGLGHLGNPAAHTPNFDALCGTDGVSFRNAFCQNPVCGPSRCSFMTGWYPHVRGHRTQHYMLGTDEPFLIRRLKESGYFVWWGSTTGHHVAPDYPRDLYCDVFHERSPGAKNWFGNWAANRPSFGEPGYYSMYGGRLDKGDAEVFFDRDWDYVHGAMDFLRSAPRDRSLCIYINLAYPHPPYTVEEPWFSAIDRRLVPPRIPTPGDWSSLPAMVRRSHERLDMDAWTEKQWTELRATYLGMCARVDHQFGMLLDALRETGIYDETAVFALSDHGDYTGDYGLIEKNTNCFHDALTNVLFAIKPPASTPVEPRVSDALVELIDMRATIEELTDTRPDCTHFGRSLVPVLCGETDGPRDAVFS